MRAPPIMPSKGPVKKGKTLIVLLDFQNDLAKPGGTRHCDVTEVMIENNMIHKVEEVVETARKWGALVIHSPTDHGAFSSQGELSDVELANSTWASNIVDELQPKENDIVFERRPSAWDLDTARSKSSLEGIYLKSTIEKNEIQSIILLGFLSDVSVVNTAIGLSDEFPSLNIIVCHDGTASTKEKHEGSMKTTLPMVGVDVISCEEALGVIRSGGNYTSSRKLIRQDTQNMQDQEETVMRSQYNVFEMSSILAGSGVLVPTEILVAAFSYGRSKASNIKSTDPFYSFSLVEINDFLGKMLCGKEENILRVVALDIASVFNFAAGLFLFVGLFPLPSAVNNITGGLLANVFYLIAIGQSTIGGPAREWNDMINVENSVQDFKESIRMNAKSYCKKRRAALIKNSSIAANADLPQRFVQQMQYIEEIMYSGNTQVLTKTDVEMLLVRELGTSYISRILEYVLLKASKTNSHAISPAEFHQFIATNEKSSDYLSRAWFIFTHTVLDLGYLMGVCFFLALALTIVDWTLCQFGIFFNFFAYTWLYFVGTLGFSELSYKRVRDAYDAKERAHGLVDDCIRYAQFYNRDDPMWKQFNETKSLDVKAFRHLLEHSDILLNEDELDDLVKTINVDGDSRITQEELESFLDRDPPHRQLSILRNCLRNFSFLANSTWFLGAVGYAVYHYQRSSASNIVGAVGYFCGGSAYGYMNYKTSLGRLRSLAKLRYATKRLLRIASRRFVLRTTLVNVLLERLSNSQSLEHPGMMSIYSKEEGQTWRNLDWTRQTSVLSYSKKPSSTLPEHQVQEQEPSISDPAEDFLSSLISHTSSNGLAAANNSGLKFLSRLEYTSDVQLVGSFYMYRLTLNKYSGEHAGILLYPSCFDHFMLDKICASVSDDRSKLLVTVPTHSPIKPKEKEKHGDLSRSPSLVEENFGHECWIPTLIQADLPIEIGSINSLDAPTTVYSRDRTRSLLHFKLHEEEPNYNQQSENKRSKFSTERLSGKKISFAEDLW